eukprot:jgi/Chrpa1/22237/Chrysochromulina_OHIO_Genome00023916-RA
MVSLALFLAAFGPASTRYLYTYTSPSGEILWIAVYVDDALICDSSPELRARFVADLSERFPTEDKGELSWILNHVPGALRRRPHHQVRPLPSRRLPDSALDCPMDEGLVLTDDDQPEVGTQDHEDMAVRRDAYMSLVGGLLWLANMSLPLIAYPTGQLARFLTNPGPSHFQAALRVLLYVRQHVIFSDSKSAVDMSIDPIAFKRPSTFSVRLSSCVIKLKHLPGKIMLADVLTKAVARAIFLLLTRLLAEYSTTRVASPT